MNVFITGATGFIGRRLLELIENDERFENIYCLCRRGQPFSSKVNTVTGSLEELENLPPVKADVCIHLAAVTDSSAADKKDVFKINAEGTSKVVEFCKRSSIPRIVFFSSANVYLKRRYSYALSKISAEEYIKDSGLSYSIVRCALVYGKGCSSFEKIIRYADLLHIIPVTGTGKAFKQPVYIDDVCNEIIRLVFSKEGNTVTDLYGKIKMTYDEMVKMILSVSGRRALLLHLPVAPFRIMSEFCYKKNIPFPVSPEQISHLCEDTCCEAEVSSDPDEFIKNLRRYM